MFAIRGASLALVALTAGVPTTNAQKADSCQWQPTASGRVARVRDVAGLEDAVNRARPGETILVANGDYKLRQTLEIQTEQVTIRSESGDRNAVVLRGGGMMTDTVGVAVGISAVGVTLANMTIRDVAYHAVQVRGETGASRFRLQNMRLLDTGQQLLKGSISASRAIYADDGVIACSLFAYTDSAPGNYTNGVDLLGTRGWAIHDNRFERIRGPQNVGFSAGPAVLIWAASENTLVERNIVVDSFRGIALGLTTDGEYRRQHGPYDHLGGRIVNNIVVNLHPWADEGIEVNAARDVRIEHNTVLVEGTLPWAISVRFPATSAFLRNNLANRRIELRNGGRAMSQGNVTTAVRSWFVDPTHEDFRLSREAVGAVDAGDPILDVPFDFAGMPRHQGRAPDAGAMEKTD